MSSMIFDELKIKDYFEEIYKNLEKIDFLYKFSEEVISDLLVISGKNFNSVLFYGYFFDLIKKVSNKKAFFGHVVEEYLKGKKNTKCYSEENIQIEKNSFDLIISNLSLHFINDFPGAILKYRESLAKGGIFIASIMGGGSFKEMREILSMADQKMYGGVFPRVIPMIDLDTASNVVRKCGFSSNITHSEVSTLSYDKFFDLIEDFYCFGLNNFICSKKNYEQDFLKCAEDLFWDKYGHDNKLKITLEVIFCYLAR